jgi:hypothetical protein
VAVPVFVRIPASIALLAGDGLGGDSRGVFGTVFEEGGLAGAAISKFNPTKARRFRRNNSAADQLRALCQYSVTPV